MTNIYLQLLDQFDVRIPLALATVISATGSTPQKPGSSAIFSREGLSSGTVGGGPVEEQVRQAAQKAITEGISGLLTFDLANDISLSEDPICGGKMDILLDAAPGKHRRVFEQIRLSLQEGQGGILATIINTTTISRFWLSENSNLALPANIRERTEPVIAQLFSMGRKGNYTVIPASGEAEMLILEPVFPHLRLVIAGAGHIGKALSHLGKLLEFEVTVIDEREEYANRMNLPDANVVVVNDIGKAFRELKKTPDTFVVIVTRGHKCDAEALLPCIGAELAYLGMIGSKKKIAEMRRQFLKEGWATQEQWDHLHAPIGLPIHSQTVQEIAVSIAAQLIQVRNHEQKP